MLIIITILYSITEKTHQKRVSTFGIRRNSRCAMLVLSLKNLHLLMQESGPWLGKI